MRKQFKIKLLDGKEYLFAERNKEDIDFSHLQEEVRISVFERIKQYEDEKRVAKEMADDLRYVNFQKVYSEIEISAFIASHPDEITRLVYVSFKINNPAVTFEAFKKMVDAPLAKKILSDINELERGEPLPDKDCANSIGMNFEKFKALAKTQPEVYHFLKHNLKKSPEKK